MTADPAPLDTLRDAARKLRDDPSTPQLYEQTAEALSAAVRVLPELPGVAGTAEAEDMFEQLIIQAAPGLHRLAAHMCHLANSGLPQTVEQMMTILRAALARLAARKETLTQEDQRRLVLFAITTRAWAKDGLPKDQISRWHIVHFGQFDLEDLALPYSVMFSTDFFGQNTQDLITHFLPGGHLIQNPGLPPAHVLLLAWLLSDDIFAGPVSLEDVLQGVDMSVPAHAAAARSLILRFGLGAQGTALGTQLGLANWPDARPQPKPRALARLQTKPHQAVHAALNRVKIALPFLQPLQRKPKVALCLSGQLRGYRVALASWQARLLPLIDAQVFVHCWQDVGRSGAQPFRAVLPFAGDHFCAAYKEVGTALGFEETQRRYPSLFKALAEGARVTQAEIQALYHTDHVVLDDETTAPFSDFTNQQKMHYKIHAADKLARNTGTDVDLMIRLRPDLSLRDIGVGWSDLLQVARAAPVLFAEKSFGVHYGGPMIGDQCAIATPQTMQVYADTWTEFPKLVSLGLGKMPDAFTGHVSLAQTCWLQGLHVVRAPIRFGQLHDAEKLSTSDCLRALEADSRGTAEDEKLCAAARADL